jgi:hypothetical protein
MKTIRITPLAAPLVLCAVALLSGCVAYPVYEYRDGDGRSEYRNGQWHHEWRFDRYHDPQLDHDHFHNGRADG